MKILALDIGGTFTKYGVFKRPWKAKARPIRYGKIPTPRKTKEFKDVMEGIVLDSGITPRDTISISIPYPYLEGKDRWESPNLRIKRLKLKNFFSGLARDVYIQNDANLAALAESRVRSIKNLVFVTLGTGLGTGAVLDGKLYTGQGLATELGHTVIVKGGARCSCGKRGCAEAYISARAIQRYFGREASIEEIADLARGGKKKALKAFNEFSDYLAIFLSNIANALHPDAIVLGGGLIKTRDLFLDDTKRKFKEYPFTQITRTTRILVSRFGERASMYGAYLYALKDRKKQ